MCTWRDRRQHHHQQYYKILPILHIKAHHHVQKTFHQHFKFETNLLAKCAGERGLRCALPASSWRPSTLHILPAQDMTWYDQNVRQFRVSQSAVAALHTHTGALWWIPYKKIHMPYHLQICLAVLFILTLSLQIIQSKTLHMPNADSLSHNRLSKRSNVECILHGLWPAVSHPTHPSMRP